MSDEALNEALAQVAEWTSQANDYELRWHRAENKNRELSQRVWDLQKRIDPDAAVIKQLEQHAATQAEEMKALRAQLDEALATVARLTGTVKDAEHLCKWLMQSDISPADRERVTRENGIAFSLAVASQPASGAEEKQDV